MPQSPASLTCRIWFTKMGGQPPLLISFFYCTATTWGHAPSLRFEICFIRGDTTFQYGSKPTIICPVPRTVDFASSMFWRLCETVCLSITLIAARRVCHTYNSTAAQASVARHWPDRQEWLARWVAQLWCTGVELPHEIIPYQETLHTLSQLSTGGGIFVLQETNIVNSPVQTSFSSIAACRVTPPYTKSHVAYIDQSLKFRA